MYREDYHDEEPRHDDDRDLIADNVQRIKDLIYGNDGDLSTTGRPGHGTSGRDDD